MTPPEAVTGALQNATFGPPAGFENLSIIPLLAREEREPDYLTLDEALARGWVEIEEVNGAGRVPELTVVNHAAKGVLLLDGEELVGAKQNRVINLTVLIPPRRTTLIPVSCVEAGRWHPVSRRFAASPRVQFAEGRAAKMRDVSASLQESRSRQSDQGAVWSRISEKSARLGVHSDTSAMSHLFESMGTSIEAYVGAFRWSERQSGAVFVVNGRPAGLELFDAPSTWRKLAPKLLRSYALDAIDRRVRDNERGAGAAPPDTSLEHDATAFLSAVMMSAASVFPAVGEGEDVRLSAPAVVGAALVAGGHAVHVSAFSTAATM